MFSFAGRESHGAARSLAGAAAEAPLARAALLLVLLLTPAAFAPLRHAGFVQDDHLAVEANPIVARGEFSEIISTSYWAGANGADTGLYRPLTILSFALERRLTGEPNPFVAHAVNVGLHLANALLLFGLLGAIGASAMTRGSAALIFALHPLHVEAVANIVGRAELLASAGTLAALWLYARAGAREPVAAAPATTSGAQRAAAWGAAALLFLALGAKETALAAAPLLLIFDLAFRPAPRGWDRRFWIDRSAALAPAALACVGYAILRVRALETLLPVQSPDPFDNPLVEVGAAARLPTALALLARYAKLLFWPFELSADYTGPTFPLREHLFAPAPLAGALLLAGLVALVARPLVTRGGTRLAARLAAFGAALFLLPYLVIGNLLVIVGTIFAERLAYLPSAGYAVLFGLTLGSVARGALQAKATGAAGLGSRVVGLRFAALAVAALCTAFATLTWVRCVEWRDDESVFRAAVAVRPASPRANLIVGKALSDRGESEAALEWFERALAAAPTYVAAWNERGVALGRLARYDEAIVALRSAVREGPQHAGAWFNLGVALRRAGRVDEAERALRHALLRDPLHATAWAEMGHMQLEAGRPAVAAEAYRRAVALGRRDLEPRLADARRRAGMEAR